MIFLQSRSEESGRFLDWWLTSRWWQKKWRKVDGFYMFLGGSIDRPWCDRLGVGGNRGRISARVVRGATNNLFR